MKSNKVKKKSMSKALSIQDDQRKSQRENYGVSSRCQRRYLHCNGDVTQTYRRFKDLQKNRKPEPFILTELASDYAKQAEI
jgi:hypothetical protein